MTNNEIEKQYSELKKKYKLPGFKEIDWELELSDLEQTNFLIRAIMRRIAEKLEFYSTMLEEVLQPDASNIYAMHENRFFDEDEKKQMYDIYRKLMTFSRKSVELSMKSNPEEEAEFINEFYDEWQGIKKELVRYIRKMKDSWQFDTDIKEDVGYLG